MRKRDGSDTGGRILGKPLPLSLIRAPGQETGCDCPKGFHQQGPLSDRSQTVLIVPLTRQTRHAHLPGNVLLEKGEANLPTASLARCTHVMVLDKSRLTEKVGTISAARTKEIIRNISWVLGHPVSLTEDE